MIGKRDAATRVGSASERGPAIGMGSDPNGGSAKNGG
jgi:hypothetical protein